MNDRFSSSQFVRAVIEAADRRRRASAAGRRAARLAVWGTAAVAVLAIGARLAGWPGFIGPVLWVIGAVALAGWCVQARRAHPSTDEMAGRVDADAGLNGELRSAHWFATTSGSDSWTVFHLEQAAARASAISWPAVYPPPRARRSWVAAAALSVLTFTLPLALPSWRGRIWPADVAASAAVGSRSALPAALEQQVIDAVTAIAKGEISAEDAIAELTQSPAFSRLDDATARQVVDLLTKAQTDASSKIFSGAKGGEPVSAAAARWAQANTEMEMLGEKGPPSEDPPSATAKQKPGDERNEYTDEGAAEELGEASDFQSSTRVRTKPTGAGETSQPMPMSGAPDASGEAGEGFGGRHGQVHYGTSDARTIAAAFRQEFILANENANGATKDARDRRRETRQGESSLSYTRVAGQSSFEHTRVESPRSAPETRRPLIERYFQRPDDPSAGSSAAPSGGARTE